MRARLSPQAFLELYLVAGALLFIGAGWVFGDIAEDVVTGDSITVMDARIAQWFHSHATPLMTRFMLVITHLHGTVAISTYVVVMALFLLSKRDWYRLLCVAAIPSGMLLNVLVKHAIERPRPSFEHPLLTLSTYSFPSGHVAGATLFYGIVTVMLMSKVIAWRWRLAIMFGALALVALVALSRMYLGVHYLSDVLGAFAEAIAWLTLWLLGIHTYWRHRFDRMPSRVEGDGL